MKAPTSSEPRLQQSAWAHSKVGTGEATENWHGLVDHLQAVSGLAAGFAADFGPEWGRLAGLWHDLGKFRPGFQAYIRQNADAHIEGRLPSSSEKTHSATGALHELAQLRQHWGAADEQAARGLEGDAQR